MTKVLLTGANGFIGKSILLKMQELDLVPITLIRKSTQTHFLDEHSVPTIIDSGDPGELREVIKQEKIAGILHLASYYCKEHRDSDLATLVDSNISLGLRILQSTLGTEVRWFLNTGTFWQHYNNEEYSPVNLYAATKQAFEDLAQFYIETSDLKFITLNLNDTFGPNDTRAKIFNLLLNQINSPTPLKMSGGEQIMDICYIEDVCSAFTHLIKLLESNSPHLQAGDSLALHSFERKTLREIVRDFEEVVGVKLNIEWDALPYRKREVMLPWEAGKNIPEWSPQYSFRDGVAKILGQKK